MTNQKWGWQSIAVMQHFPKLIGNISDVFLRFSMCLRVHFNNGNTSATERKTLKSIEYKEIWIISQGLLGSSCIGMQNVHCVHVGHSGFFQ